MVSTTVLVEVDKLLGLAGSMTVEFLSTLLLIVDLASIRNSPWPGVGVGYSVSVGAILLIVSNWSASECLSL